RFTARNANLSRTGRRYRLGGEEVELPISFTQDLAGMLLAEISAEVGDIFRGRLDVKHIVEERERLRKLAATLPEVLSERDQVRLVESLAVCDHAIGEQRADTESLRRADLPCFFGPGVI
ncbi:MAG: hypothetical protein ACREUE_16015, partial [Panacagrimonas sp.]